MANYYVRSGAAGTGTGANWANAFTTLAAAFAAGGVSDVFWVADDHAETQASAMTLTAPGTPAAPNRVLCVNTHATEPPTGLATSATITTTGNSSIIIRGCAYYYGVTFSAGTGSSSLASYGIGDDGTIAQWLVFDNCVIKIASTHASPRINLGQLGTGANAMWIEFAATSASFGDTSQTILLRGPLFWHDSTAIAGATNPSTLFTVLANGASFDVCEFRNVDFSSLGAGTLVSVDDNTGSFTFVDCKLGASAVIASGSFGGPGGPLIHAINSDSADTNYRYFKQTYQGIITQETTIVRSGGASDGTTSLARKMASSADARFLAPLSYEFPITIWNSSLSAITLTIPVLTDGVTLTDAEAWLEVSYLGTAGFPLGVLVSDRAANVFSTPANQPTDATSSWNDGSLGSPVKQSLSVTFTPVKAGPIYARVKLAKASTTMYFDPKPVLT